MTRSVLPPILEFPGEGRAVIEPAELYRKKARIPSQIVLTFFKDRVDELLDRGEAKPLCRLPGEGDAIQVLQLERHGQQMGLVFPGVGAPLAACTLEELIALGGSDFIFCGGAGVLREDLDAGTLVVPVRALRQEGTSYHYQENGRYSEPTRKALQAVLETLDRRGVPHEQGLTWTTDAVFRETPELVSARREEGAITVEMEASALFAVARFRGVEIAGLLYGGDDVSGDKWDSRGWMTLRDVRASMVDLALEAVSRIAPEGGKKTG